MPELLYLTTPLVVVAVQLGDNNTITEGGFYSHLTKTVIRSKWKSRGSLSQWKNKVSKHAEKTSALLSSRRNLSNRQKNSSDLLTLFREIATVDWDFCSAWVKTSLAAQSLTPHKCTLPPNNSLWWIKEIRNLPKRYLHKLTQTQILAHWHYGAMVNTNKKQFLPSFTYYQIILGLQCTLEKNYYLIKTFSYIETSSFIT